MPTSTSIPVGRLAGVSRKWDYRSGWVRAPLREIVFNDRLTKQARLLWLWLASIPDGAAASWGECETMLRCGTKARRSCMSQLVTEGFISVNEDGSVVLNDPYEVFNNKRKEILDNLREEWSQDIDFLEKVESTNSSYTQIKLEKKLDDQIEDFTTADEPEKPEKPKPRTQKKIQDDVVEAWNNCKPESYSGMRTVSIKQKECIDKHMKNLGLPKSDVKDFICTVCAGLNRSDFWLKTVDSSGRNFNSVFGYGNPQDTKMRNIENLYNLGKEDKVETVKLETKVLSALEQEIVDDFRFIRLNLSNYKARGDTAEAERYEALYQTAIAEMAEMDLNPEDY